MVIAKKATALERAISFKACNPSFHIIMRPSYINASVDLVSSKLHGKKTFRKDNNLKVGDICTFELFPTSSTPVT